MSEYSIELDNISIEFSGVKALDDVNFRLKKGEVRGLVGKNGAGKSTLMKIIQGVYTQTDGTVRLFGKEIHKHSSIRERDKSVSMIFQDYSLFNDMSVKDNVFMNMEPKKAGLIDDKASYNRVRAFFTEIGSDIDPNMLVHRLNTGDMQMVKIAKAIIKDTPIILMDEPTAALDSESTRRFFEIVKKLKSKGFSIVISTHHLKHIFEVCDSVTIVRDGRVVRDDDIKNVTMDSMISDMLGDVKFSNKHRAEKAFDCSKPLLEVREIVSGGVPHPVSFDLYSGEVLGLAGLKGSGRTEIFKAIYGLDPIKSGRITLAGKVLKNKSTSQAIRNRVFLVPENRHTEGLSLMHTLYDNLMLPILSTLTRNGLINDKKGEKIADDTIAAMSVKTPGKKVTISKLSGGNQQKIVVGKGIISRPKVIMMDDPMYGIDIHAKVEIADVIEKYTDEGNAVLFVSSEMSEMLENCDRILVIKDHRITAELRDVHQQTEDSLMAAIQ